MGEGDGTSAGIESEVAEVPIEVAGVEVELESAEVENPPEVRVVVSCTIPSPPHGLKGEHASHRHTHPLLGFGSRSTADGVAQRREVGHMCILTTLCPGSKLPDLNFLPLHVCPQKRPHSSLPVIKNKTQHPPTPPSTASILFIASKACADISCLCRRWGWWVGGICLI